MTEVLTKNAKAENKEALEEFINEYLRFRRELYEEMVEVFTATNTNNCTNTEIKKYIKKRFFNNKIVSE